MPIKQTPCKTINMNYIKCLEKNKKIVKETDPCIFQAKIYQTCLRNIKYGSYN